MRFLEQYSSMFYVGFLSMMAFWCGLKELYFLSFCFIVALIALVVIGCVSYNACQECKYKIKCEKEANAKDY